MKIVAQLMRGADGYRSKPFECDRADLANRLISMVHESNVTRVDYVIVIGQYDDQGGMEWASCPVYSIEGFISHFAQQEARNHG